MSILWQLYETPRSDCVVLVKRWGDDVRWAWSAWRAVHQPTQITSYVSFDRPVPDRDALAQLFLSLDHRVARAAERQTADALQPVAVRKIAGPDA
jgi:hypothetical protein